MIVTRGGHIQRTTGRRLQREIGQQGEKTWSEIVNGVIVGDKMTPTWSGKQPPVDVIEYDTSPRRGWQIKIVMTPKAVSFSGAQREVVGRKPGGRGNYYRGVPEDKLKRIRAWYKSQGLDGWLAIGIYDEENNMVDWYIRQGIENWHPKDMVPVALFDNNTGEFIVTEDGKKLGIGLENKVTISRLPKIPEFLQKKGEIVPIGPFRRPQIRVNGYQRMK